MKVVLPWPDSRLSPNARVFWRKKAEIVKAARADANTLTTVALPLRDKRAIAAGDGKIAMTITFYPPDKRHRDDDGMIASFKAARDGVADALGVDDRRFRPHYFFEEAAKPGRIEVEFIPRPSVNLERGENGLSNENRPDTEAA